MEIASGDYVWFTEDEWTTKHVGQVREILMYSYYITSWTYGNFYIPKSDVKLKEKCLPLI